MGVGDALETCNLGDRIEAYGKKQKKNSKIIDALVEDWYKEVFGTKD
jgi:hypothetical protein